MSTELNDLKEEEIETLARRIRQGNCILFLGPNLLPLTNEGTTINTAFALSLAKELTRDGIPFDDAGKENMPYMIQQYIVGKNKKLGNGAIQIIDIRYMYMEFIQKLKVDYSIYDSLSKIPFSMVINTNYDKKFAASFDSDQKKDGRTVQFSYYDFSNTVNNKEPITSPGKKSLLVYNIFGLCEDASINSIILTEIEFIRFISGIHQPATSIPVEITNYIKEDKHCLFLGFDFNQWHLKVVIKTLFKGHSTNVNAEKNPPISKAIGIPGEKSTGFFYSTEFNFSFINNNLKTFVEVLQKSLLTEKTEIRENPVSIVFICDTNSREDSINRDEIHKQLQKSINDNIITSWTEELATGNSDPVSITIEKIKAADIVIALVSVDFINTEKYKLIERGVSINNNPSLKKMAVLSRPCLYDEVAVLGDFNWLQTEKTDTGKLKALSQCEKTQYEATIAAIAQSIKSSL